MGRRFHYDNNTRKLLSYEQYWSDLSKINKDKKVTVELLYKTYDSPYTLTDLSLRSMKDLEARMEKHKKTFEFYYVHNMLKK